MVVHAFNPSAQEAEPGGTSTILQQCGQFCESQARVTLGDIVPRNKSKESIIKQVGIKNAVIVG